MAEISILVPVYNVEKYLGVCIDSILAQTFTDFEVICMDDGSTDQSRIILDEYARKDSRIKVIHKENTGYGKTMNMALNMAKGRYIGIVESDDTVEADMYQSLYHAVTSYDLDFVKADFYAVYDNEDGTLRKQYLSLTDDLTMYNRVLSPKLELDSFLLKKFTWNALYKKDLIIKNNIRYNETPGASFQDNGFWFQTFYWAKRVMFLDKAVYHYRQDNMLSSIHDRQKVYAMKNEFDFIRSFMKKHHDAPKELYPICFHLRMLAYIGTLQRIDLSLKKDFARIIEKERDYFEEQHEAAYDRMTEEQISIIKKPVSYVEDVLIGYREITSEVCAGYKNIIVYGAGAHGEKVVYRVKQAKEDHQTIKVAVTSLNGRSMTCQGEKVCELSGCVQDKENSLVILAVKENSDAFCQMLDCLRKYRFSHIISESAERLTGG
ncbi:MAG: glycosyltransferase [Lachnospiraceae bacterium]|nr:glycosyltransferase [Lachnospiraceae bacterium]